ncbi:MULTISPECIES: PIN domain-containing protein [unclassified Adlercreutzia]|uniref:PIN domain-containing protein n=1 Tax=unclassified Adlercreutzia TaxID=2636013 RepID=UPI0013EB8B26|nr:MULTISPECIES: PIN domain-containing protein [unclassified Adlercreutzia]
MKVLVDTCVLIDVLQAREPFLENSKRVFLASANNAIEGMTTAKAITDVFYLMHRHFHDNEKCNQVIRSLYEIFSVADTTARACLRASFSAISDFEDAVMDETAQEEKAEAIITRNISDYRSAITKVITPAEFVAQLDLDN